MDDPFQVVKDEVQRTINMAIGLYYHWCELSNNTTSFSKEELDWTTNELKNCLRSIDWDLEDLDETIVIVERYIKKFKIPPSELDARRNFIEQTKQSVKEMKDHLSNPGLKTLESTALLQESQVIGLANLNNNYNNNNTPTNSNMIFSHNNSNNINSLYSQNLPNNTNFNTTIPINEYNSNNKPTTTKHNNNIFTINNSSITMPTLSIKPITNHYTRLNEEEEDEEDEFGEGGDDEGGVQSSPAVQCLCLNMNDGNDDATIHPNSPPIDEHAVMLGSHTPFPYRNSSAFKRSVQKFRVYMGLERVTWKKLALVIFLIILIVIVIILFFVL